MRIKSIISLLGLGALLVVGCKSQQGKFEFLTPKSGETIVLGQKVALRMQFPDTTIDSVVYAVDGEVIGRQRDTAAVILDTEAIGLGTRNLVAKAYKGEKEEVAYSNVTIVPESPRQYTFEKLNDYPHDTKAFTQGLAFENGVLYESTGAGNQLISSLRKVELETGKVLQKKEFTGKSANGQEYFGEGMTILGDKIVMLTWLNNEGFVFNKSTFQQLASFDFQDSKEGWGICYDGSRLIKSDGSNKLYFLDPTTYKEVGSVAVYGSEGSQDALNELEFIDGRVYANVYGKDIIVIINPQTGAIEGQINLLGLHTNPSQPDKELNGIAYDKDTKRLFVTGKQWDKLYAIHVVER
ncbi:glutaminyl-peptide cyclotransferase [Sphingobacterium sp. LRF_L2]|uniref:glutaminyl-peptide cyclotransferase n=1 Tax=Sphingobacterium sp. LRF_L2 TaxID=3369421 RepID=UPI003F5F7141